MDSSNSGTNNPPSRFAHRRGSGPAFDSLVNAKRSTDPTSIARRASLHEQRPQTGFFGQMWHNFTRGPASPPK